MTPSSAVTRGLAALFLAGATFLLAGPGQWTQWRGPGRDGVVSTEPKPGGWPEEAVLLWEQEVGEGYSGPVVAGDRVWMHTRRGENEIVSSLTLTEGRTVWRRRYEVPFVQDHDALQHGRGPYGTPAIADGRLFTFGVTSVLSAWDAQSGGLLWRRDYSEEFEPSYPYFGQASSPLVSGDLCFAHFGITAGEGADRGAMVALDVTDGSERWRWDEDSPSVGSSPVLAEIGGRLQLVFKSKMLIVGLDPETGAELWRIRYIISQDNTIVTPLFIGDQLVTSDWQEGLQSWVIERVAGSEALSGDEVGEAVAADAGRGRPSETWRARDLWQTRDASIYTSSPVLVKRRGQPHPGLVAGFSHFRSGQLFLLDPTSGDVIWRGDGRSGEHVSLAVWGEDLLVFDEDGYLAVGPVSRDGFQPLHRYRLGDSIAWTHPAVLAGSSNRILVKDGSRLAVYAFD